MATDLKALWAKIREAVRSHASGPPSSSEGESGCLFDEISNLDEPIERPGKEARAGSTSHGRRDDARTARPDEEY
jgi:hypothetical protein